MRKKKFSTPVFLLLGCVSIAGCGQTRLERAGSGATIGAVAGAGAGALCCLGSGVGAGAAIGAVGGAAVGAALSEPLFFNHEAQYWPYEAGAN